MFLVDECVDESVVVGCVMSGVQMTLVLMRGELYDFNIERISWLGICVHNGLNVLTDMIRD